MSTTVQRNKPTAQESNALMQRMQTIASYGKSGLKEAISLSQWPSYAMLAVTVANQFTTMPSIPSATAKLVAGMFSAGFLIGLVGRHEVAQHIEKSKAALNDLAELTDRLPAYLNKTIHVCVSEKNKTFAEVSLKDCIAALRAGTHTFHDSSAQLMALRDEAVEVDRVITTFGGPGRDIENVQHYIALTEAVNTRNKLDGANVKIGENVLASLKTYVAQQRALTSDRPIIG